MLLPGHARGIKGSLHLCPNGQTRPLQGHYPRGSRREEFGLPDCISGTTQITSYSLSELKKQILSWVYFAKCLESTPRCPWCWGHDEHQHLCCSF